MDEIQRLARMIKQVQWGHHRALDSLLRAELGISIVQWDALRAIVNEPGASARRLAAATFQSEQSFGVMATGMQRRGLITRMAGTGRTIEHRATPEGQRLLEAGSRFADEVFARTLGGLDPSQREELRRLLDLVLTLPLDDDECA